MKNTLATQPLFMMLGISAALHLMLFYTPATILPNQSGATSDALSVTSLSFRLIAPAPEKNIAAKKMITAEQPTQQQAAAMQQPQPASTSQAAIQQLQHTLQQPPKPVAAKKQTVAATVKHTLKNPPALKKIPTQADAQPTMTSPAEAVATKNVSATIGSTNKPDTHNAGYLQQLLALIEKKKFYPDSAKRRKIEGSVKISMTIDNTGYIMQLETLSGPRMLKKAARKAVLQAQPFPQPPLGLSGEKPVLFAMDYKISDLPL